MTPSILALCPPHHCDAQIAIAAIRAGEWGVLDLSLAPLEAAATQLQWLIQQSRGQRRWGIRCEAMGGFSTIAVQFDNLQSRDIPLQQIPLLIVAGGPSNAEYPAFATEALHRARLQADCVLAEVYSAEHAVTAQEIGFDGVILKGHEAGGRVSRKSAFLFIQHVRDKLRVPFWVQGGLGPQTAAAAFLAGAAGIVLSEQFWLARESPISQLDRSRFMKSDGSETVCLGDERGQFRFYSRSGRGSLQELEREFISGCEWPQTLFQEIRQAAIAQEADHRRTERLIPVGQEIAFAAKLAATHLTVGGILEAYRRGVAQCVDLAPRQGVLAAGSPLAEVHRTKYPILQGPMTRVSDVAGFCQHVADSGALPFLALALLRESAVRQLMSEVSEQMQDESWGVGILGFVPPDLRNEQLAVILKHPPKFAIIAGGRPSQASELEQAGISTYLHAPSRGLLETFIRDGARKFIFEGRECGGHVGPMCSFSLWQSAITTLLEADIDDPENFQIVFAGGIHDDFSAAMVATAAAPLAERGMKVGVLMGTAYLFTHEAVASGAITEEFQRQALTCGDTALVESGVGHATRCAITPFVSDFATKKQELVLAGASPEEVRGGLEMFNIGRLRIASKGVARKSSLEANPDRPESEPTSDAGEDAKARALRDAAAELTQNPSELVTVDVDAQRKSGMFMIGEVAALRDTVTSAAELHEQVSQGGVDTLRHLAVRDLPWAQQQSSRRPPQQEDLAIVGMSALFPDSPNLRRYWENLVDGFDAIREVPSERWSVENFYSSDRFARDRIYSKWGAFVGDVVIDPMKYQIPPASMFSIEPIQLLALEVAGEALQDAGFERPDFPRDRTSVIYAAAGSHEHGMRYAFRTAMRHYLPMVEGLSEADRERIYDSLESQLPEWTEDSFAGFLMNVVAGRISNRFDLRGSNFVVDAACASSLAALQIAVEQLRAGICDAALVGAVDGTNNPFCYMCFAKTHALSPDGHSKSFDASADGIALGEGIGSVVLKRLSDAERDGDFIYAVIKGIGSSSDGRNRSLTAPFPEGQLQALHRAYHNADVSPATVTLIEAHSTGTTVGDQVECEALQRVMSDAGAQPQSCALGSVKSMIGHAKTAAGMASLIKTTLALKHRTLPPTIGVETPNQVLQDAASALYVNSETRPWLVPDDLQQRRAGVSSFGFGGTNFHVVLEEYTGAYHEGFHLDLNPRPCELFAWKRSTRGDLCQAIEQLHSDVLETPNCNIAELAAALFNDDQQRANGDAHCRLALLASSVDDLREKLQGAGQEISQSGGVHRPEIYYSESPSVRSEQICFLFPGQGSQSVNMLRELVLCHPQLHPLFAAADAASVDVLERPLSSYLFPRPLFDKDRQATALDEVNNTRIAQPAMAVADLFCFELLRRYGVVPGMTAGHSFGEYVALCAAGAMSSDDLFRVAALRGRSSHLAGIDSPGAMAAVAASAEETLTALKAAGSDALLANVNAPKQSVIAGSVESIEAAVDQLLDQGLTARKLKVSAAFHTPALAAAAKELQDHLQAAAITAPSLPVYSNTTAEVYSDDPDEIRRLLTRHIVEPVQFDQQIRRMYEQGARIFIEAGPGSVLTNLMGRILADKPHTAVAVAPANQGAWTHWGRAIAQLYALGVPVDLKSWFQYRRLPHDGLRDHLKRVREQNIRKPTEWIVNTSRAESVSGMQQKRPAKQEEERLPQAESPPPAVVRSVPPLSEPESPPDEAHEHNPSVSQTGVRRMSSPATTPSKTQGNGSMNGEHSSVLSNSNEIMARWLELQSRQMETNERFLEMHERITLACLNGSNGADAVPPAQYRQRLNGPVRPTAAPHLSGPSSRRGNEESRRSALVNAPESSRPPTTEGSRSLASRPVQPASSDPVTPMAKSAATPSSAPPSTTSTTPDRQVPAQKATPAPAQTATVAAPEQATPPETAEFRQDLLEAVSDRTGYPIDMLDETALLEGDLGIDSIKTVEIFSSLTKYHKFLPGGGGVEEESLGEFAKLKTLRDIVDMYDRSRDNLGEMKSEAAAVTDPQSDGTSADDNGQPDHARLQRYEVTAVNAPLAETEKKNILSNSPS